MDQIQKDLLRQIADLHDVPAGAYNIRANSEGAGRRTTANIDIITKEDKPGIDIKIKAGTKNESVHIPVVISETGIEEMVYNDFFIGEGADVVIVAGCGIHNSGDEKSRHDGIHTFYVGKNARVKYVEKHYGSGDGNGERIMNPKTVCILEDGAYLEMDTVQIGGVDSTDRVTEAKLGEGATIVVSEKIMTHGSQSATTTFKVDLDGADSSAHVISRSVAKDDSKQLFISEVNGNNRCSGHTECDAIVMDNATVSAVPKVSANDVEASLIHEAAIGKIAGEQLMKLMTLGLSEKDAEEHIINGFLK